MVKTITKMSEVFMKKLLIGLLVLGSVSSFAQENYSEVSTTVKKNMQWTWVSGAEIDKAIENTRFKAKAKCEKASLSGKCKEVQANIVRIVTSEDQGYLTTEIMAEAVFTPVL
jgi:hypothetical protein